MDPEIKAQFEETRRHFDVVAEGMRGELQLVSEHLSSRLESVSSRTDRIEPAVEETRRHFDVVTEGMRAHVQLVADETRRHFDVVADGMRAHVQLVADETRRHFDVVAEGMRSDVRLVAEGVSSLAERVDRVEENLREEIRQTRTDLTALITISYGDLDRRVRRLESDL
jgi:hypothetical protein